MIRTALLADPVSKQHDTGFGHPEKPERWDAAVAGLSGHALTPFALRRATVEELTLCHTPGYLATARADVAKGASSLSTGDTDICALSFDVAVQATGTCLHAVDLVMRREAENAFCIVRPPGHHATPDRGMGFCMFNNVAVAARYAQREYGVERVLIADWDVHHGNGTQDIFYSDPTVFFFSTHQWPLYPGTGSARETGTGAGTGFTCNCPLPAGSGREDIVGAFERQLVPGMEEFRPELVLISAGFDSRIGDPLGGFRLLDQDFADLTKLMLGIAERYAQGRLVSVLEGGYSLDGLTRAVSAHANELMRANSSCERN